MPTLSASDYTRYLKFKAATVSSIRPEIQTRANVTTSQSLLNAETLASQAAFVIAPAATTVATSSARVTNAQTDIITDAVASSANIVYATSQSHGLVAGQTITITGIPVGTLTVNPNMTAAVTAVLSDTSFRIQTAGVSGVSGTGTGSITGRVYYTANASHGLMTGDVATVTGVGVFSTAGAAVLASPSATTFVLSSSTTGTAVSGASGVLSFSRVSGSSVSITGNARVRPVPVVQFRSNPDARSTVSYAGTSGALGSSATQRSGGLPTGFKNSQGTYTRLPQSAGW